MFNQRYQIISHREIEMIHENSMKIMENVGIKMTYQPAKDVLAKHGARVDGDFVYFPRKLVEDAIKLCPSSYTIHARNPEKNVEISLDRTAFAGPYGAPFVTDMDRGRHDGSMEDFINIVKICDRLENIDLHGHIACEPNDVPVEKRPNIMMYNTLKYSDKPLMGSVYGYETAKQCIEMAAIANGTDLNGVKEKPVVVAIPCTLTPLCYDDNMLGSLMAYAEFGQPQLVNSLSIAGMTAPATIAGLISLQNAEVLAGIVLAQCVNPGTPIVYSASGSSAEMRRGVLTIGAPEDAVISLINGQLAKYYQIPCRISGALSDAKLMDSQAAYEAAVTLMMAQMGGGNFILHGAGILETYNCICLEKLIVDNEIIGNLKRINQGVEVNEDTLAYDVISEVGPGGTFLVEDHTLEYFRSEFYAPTLSDRSTYEQWEANGKQPIEKIANEKWKQILAEYGEPNLPADLDAELKKYADTH